jgi:hypothetical protein
MSEEPGGSLRPEREKTDFLFTVLAPRSADAGGRPAATRVAWH